MDRRCADCRELISAFIDGELSVDERAWLRSHLATCEECRAVLDGYKNVGTAVRSLPRVQPPADLVSAIYAKTIDSEPRRLVLFTNRLGYSIGAVAAILLVFVVAGYLLIGGYQRSVMPAVTASNPANGETIQPNTPIEIQFNKAMNHESVEAALGMQPLGSEEGLSITWDGNTLIIGGNKFLTPNTDYKVLISADARDKWGNRLEQSFELSFGTAPTIALDIPTPSVSTPVAATPTVNVPPTSTPTSTAEPTVDSSDSGIGGGDEDATPSLAAPTATNPTTSDDGSGDDGTGSIGAISTATPVAVAPDPATPTPTRTPAPQPTATPSPSPTLPVPTATATLVPATPTATATATATPEPTATPSPTPDVIPVTGDIGSVYWGNAYVQDRLGEATDYAFTSTIQTLGFQRASMLYRADTGMIYVMPTDTGVWDIYYDSSTTLPVAEPGPEAGTWTPGGIFGYLWHENPSIEDLVGYAVQQNSTTWDATLQTFDNGLVVVFDGTALIFYGDGTKDQLVVVN